MSIDLDRAVREAQTALAHDVNGALPLASRRRIWRALGPVEMNADEVAIGDGLRRRVALADLAVRRVLPVWEAAFPGDGRAAHMLEIARLYMVGELSWDAAWAAGDHFWGRLDSLLSSGVDAVAVYVGYAAANVRTLALQDESGIGPEAGADAVSAVQSDGDLDPYTWDASYYASLAAAKDVRSEFALDADRRRAFWQWYLQHAVPAAWDAATQRSSPGADYASHPAA